MRMSSGPNGWRSPDPGAYETLTPPIYTFMHRSRNPIIFLGLTNLTFKCEMLNIFCFECRCLKLKQHHREICNQFWNGNEHCDCDMHARRWNSHISDLFRLKNMHSFFSNTFGACPSIPSCRRAAVWKQTDETGIGGLG